MWNWLRSAVIVGVLAMAWPAVAADPVTPPPPGSLADLMAPMRDAAKAYDQKDYTTAFRLFKSLASDIADPFSIFMLGFMYYNGQGTLQNYAEAAKFWKLSAEFGNIDAQFNIASMYYSGQGIPQNYVEAAKWWKLSADGGNTEAQNHICLMYYIGRASHRIM